MKTNIDIILQELKAGRLKKYLKQPKEEKATGPNDTPIEAFKELDEDGLEDSRHIFE